MNTGQYQSARRRSNMNTGLLLFIFLRLSARAQPLQGKEKESSCIEMTPERADEINEIAQEVNSFINELSDKHADIDFTLVKLNVEKHSDDEEEEKETILKIEVNDCNNDAMNHPKQEDRYFENDDNDSNDSKNKHEQTEDTCNEDSKCENEKTANNCINANNENDNGDDIDNDDANERDDETENWKTHKQSNYSRVKPSELKGNEIPLRENVGSHREEENTGEIEETPKNKQIQIIPNHSNTSNDQNLMSKNDGHKDDLIKDFDDVETRDEKKQKVETNLTKNYNFNDNSNVYISHMYMYAPNIDNSHFEMDNYNINDNLYNPDLRKFMNLYDELANIYTNSYASNYGLEQSYENIPAEENVNFFYIQPTFDHYSVEDYLRNAILNDIMLSAENVHRLAESCREHGGTEIGENYNVNGVIKDNI